MYLHKDKETFKEIIERGVLVAEINAGQMIQDVLLL